MEVKFSFSASINKQTEGKKKILRATVSMSGAKLPPTFRANEEPQYIWTFVIGY